MTSLVDAVTLLVEAERADRKTRDTAAAQARIEKALRQMWRAQRRGVLAALARMRTQFPEFEEAHLSEAIHEDDLDAAFDQVADRTSSPIIRRLDIELPRALSAGGGSGHRDLGIEGAFDVGHPDAVAFLEERGAARVTMINDATRSQLQTVMGQAAEDGWSWQRTARAIEERFAGFSTPAPQAHLRTRAELVATNELAEAYEEGHRIVRSDLAGQGLEVEKAWLNVGDDRVSAGCLANSDAGWIGDGESFPSGASAPPEHPGCRCSSQSRVAPDEE